MKRVLIGRVGGLFLSLFLFSSVLGIANSIVTEQKTISFLIWHKPNDLAHSTEFLGYFPKSRLDHKRVYFLAVGLPILVRPMSDIPIVRVGAGD
jgi:hypothetical protein